MTVNVILSDLDERLIVNAGEILTFDGDITRRESSTQNTVRQEFEITA